MVRTVKKKDLYKLAQLIKLAGKDISKEENSLYKTENVSMMCGLQLTDKTPGIIEVEDDSGYRAIRIGDTRGNVSYDTGNLDNNLSHHGHMVLYYENCSYDANGNRVWKFRCFPPMKELVNRLWMVANYKPLIPETLNNCDSNEYWYDKNTASGRKYLGDLVRQCVSNLEKDTRTAQEIFSSWQ